MYNGFDEYPPYSGTISENFETNINSHICCDHGFPYSTIKGNMLIWINKRCWETTKYFFTEANKVKKILTTKEYKYERKQSNKIFYFPQRVNIHSLHHIFMKTLYLM